MNENSRAEKLQGSLFVEVFRTSLDTLALLALRQISKSAFFEHCLHDNFTATIRAEKFLSRNRCTRVLTGSSHDLPPSVNLVYRYYTILSIIVKLVNHATGVFFGSFLHSSS